MARRPAARPASRPAPRRANSASPRGGRSGGSRNQGRDGMPGWVWLLAGAAITLFIVVIVHLAQPRHAAQTVAVAPAAPVAAPRPQPVKPVPVPPKQPSRFSFYEMLPSREVVIPAEEAEKAVKATQGGKPLPAELAAPGAYIVQVGAYRSRDEAERARASVALLGVEAHTEQVTLSAGDIWYRVRIGPESSLDKAQDIVDRLHTNGAKAILIKQKS